MMLIGYPPALEQIRAGVGRLNLVPDHMRQGRFDNLAWMIRLLGGPIPERRAETVRHGRNLMLFEEPAQPFSSSAIFTLGDKYDRTSAVAKRSGCIENFQGAATQRHPMLAPCLREVTPT